MFWLIWCAVFGAFDIVTGVMAVARGDYLLAAIQFAFAGLMGVMFRWNLRRRRA